MGIGVIIGVLSVTAWGTLGRLAEAQSGCQSFPQTGHKVCGKFLTYWNTHGGLAQQGYPLSEEFTETSDLNGKPYTVQYFERAVFELHHENKPPFDVLLSQLGAYLGNSKYVLGFPASASEPPYYENLLDSAGALKSYYNAINRKEYERAYSYFDKGATVQPYPQFAAGYANTASVTLALNLNFIEDPGAGNIYAAIRVVLTAMHKDGSKHLFSGCYIMHRVNTGISEDPNDELWHISSAKLVEVPANSSIDALLAQECVP
jgi:hypothetical protein